MNCATPSGLPSQGPYRGRWSGPIFVLTHEPFEAPEGITVTAGDIREVVASALEAAAGKRVELFGANVAAQAFAHGLTDLHFRVRR